MLLINVVHYWVLTWKQNGTLCFLAGWSIFYLPKHAYVLNRMNYIAAAKQSKKPHCLEWAEHVNVTVTGQTLAIRPEYAGFFFYFYSIVLLFFAFFFFFFNSNSARFHWFWKCCKWIKRACFSLSAPSYITRPRLLQEEGLGLETTAGCCWRRALMVCFYKKESARNPWILCKCTEVLSKEHRRELHLVWGWFESHWCFLLWATKWDVELARGIQADLGRGTKASLPRASYCGPKTMQLFLERLVFVVQSIAIELHLCSKSRVAISGSDRESLGMVEVAF